MDKVRCELCPLQDFCPERKQERIESEASYHPQEVVRVYTEDCPLLKVIKPEEARD